MKLPQGKSAFLWGARKTGKSTFLRQHFPKSIYFDFLNHDVYLNFIKSRLYCARSLPQRNRRLTAL
jgi:predicted AAA+ superfamily ATPase